MKREIGWYWVKYYRGSHWRVAEYDGSNWWLTSDDQDFSASDFYLIGDRIEEPTEDGS